MSVLERGPLPEKRKSREVLSPRLYPLVEKVLAGINIDDFNIEQTRRFGNALLRARDLWSDQYRGGRRYSDRETAQVTGLVRRTGGAK
ncbi:hypothetical protein U8326_10130 [Tsuneonella sp. CC-YZS046]|uniref:hypothetical protein n=1 Tax=Tsuneonella sp. CC-YZS046 TaxID=3042152 RepID=UPI002D78080C|nr:hypothetical protein [Tsuneonella sp. CC-YZS046]WRO65418.1 hypothetical protein U8326_10130 [Tsuneonella sp. CC-YZS046]